MALDLEKEVGFKYPLKDICFLSFSDFYSFIELKFTQCTICSFKVCHSVAFSIVQSCAFIITTVHFRTFSSALKETSCPLVVAPHVPSTPLALGNLWSTFCLYSLLILEISCKWNHIIKWSLCLASFTYRDVVKARPCCCMYQNFIFIVQ